MPTREEYHEEVQRLRAIQAGENEAQPRYRMPLARVVELLLTKPQRPPTEEVEVTRNAKGDVQFSVKGHTQEGETLEEASARVMAVVDSLATAYELSRAQIFARKTTPDEK